MCEAIKAQREQFQLQYSALVEGLNADWAQLVAHHMQGGG